MDGFAPKMYEICTALKPFVIGLTCLSLVMSGIMMVFPSQKVREIGKDALPWVMFGCAVALGGVTFGQWLGKVLAF